MSVNLVGISGAKRSGKDTLFDIMQEFNSKYRRIRFADALKGEIYNHVLEPNGISADVLDRDDTKEAYRLLMQWWGTEFRRNMYSEEYWIDRAMDMVKFYAKIDHTIVCVITDVRFPNEAKRIKDAGGILIRINSGLRNPVQYPHPSETALDDWEDWDIVLDNNATLGEFRASALAMCANID